MSVFVKHSDSSHGFKAIKNQIIALMATLLLSACATIPVEERATHRQKINTRADNTISALVAKKPELVGELDACVGYFVGHVSGVKAPAVGAGIGMVHPHLSGHQAPGSRSWIGFGSLSHNYFIS